MAINFSQQQKQRKQQEKVLRSAAWGEKAKKAHIFWMCGVERRKIFPGHVCEFDKEGKID